MVVYAYTLLSYKISEEIDTTTHIFPKLGVAAALGFPFLRMLFTGCPELF